MSFRSVFIAVVAAFALIVAAFLINRARPKTETEQPTADFVRASGKCAECHARLQYSVVHEYEMSAHARAFLLVPLLINVTRRYLDLCLLVMIVQALVGVLGFWFHMQANLVEPSASLWDRLVNGAPPMAPLLFPNLVGLALIGLWALIPHVPEAPQGTSWLGATYAWAHPDNDT
jgi:hypothetical protein